MTPQELDYMTLDELIAVCLTEPAHIAIAGIAHTDTLYGQGQDPDWYTEMEARASIEEKQTYQGFVDMVARHAPRPFVPKANCDHKHEYATLRGMFCRECHNVREAANDFERRLISKLTPRSSSYVNYGMR